MDGVLEPIFSILIGLTWALVSMAVGYYIIKRKLKDPELLTPVWNGLQEIINAEKKDLGANLDTMAERFADSLSKRVFGHLGGEAAATPKLEKGLASAMVDDMIAKENPIFGMLMNQFPQVKDYLMKNPQAVQSLLPMLEGFMKGKGKSISSATAEFQY